MKPLSDLLSLNHIILDKEISSKKRLFEEVGKLLEQASDCTANEIFECLFNREKLGSTGLGQGIAIPHGRLSTLNHPLGAFVRTKEAIDFDAPDGKPVSLVFVLLVPEEATGEHLEILSHLVGKFAEKSARDVLLHSQSPAEISQLLTS